MKSSAKNYNSHYVSMDNVAFANCKARLQERFSREPFRYGYIHYPPFIHGGNTRPHGPLVDFIENGLCRDLKIDSEPERIAIDWSDVVGALNNGVHIVITPIIYGRKKIALIPYCDFQALVLVYKDVKPIKRAVMTSFSEINKLISDLSSNKEFFRVWKDIHDKLEDLNTRWSGFAATKGTIAYWLMEELFEIEIRSEFSSGYISENIKSALGKDPPFLMVADEPSYQQIRNDIGHHLMTRFFSPNGAGFWLPTGFATRQDDDDLINYISNESLLGSEKYLESCLVKIKENRIDGIRFYNEPIKFNAIRGSLPKLLLVPPFIESISSSEPVSLSIYLSEPFTERIVRTETLFSLRNSLLMREVHQEVVDVSSEQVKILSGSVHKEQACAHAIAHLARRQAYQISKGLFFFGIVMFLFTVFTILFYTNISLYLGITESTLQAFAIGCALGGIESFWAVHLIKRLIQKQSEEAK